MSKVSKVEIESDKSWEDASLNAIQQARATVLGFKPIDFDAVSSPSFGKADLTFKKEASHERFMQRVYRNKERG